MCDDIILPFEFEDVYHGFAVSKGLIKINKDYLIFEYQISDNFFSLIKSDVKTVNIPHKKIINVQLKKNWFSTKLLFSFNSISVLNQFPSSPKELILKIKKDNRQLAESLISRINLRISEIKLENLDKS